MTAGGGTSTASREEGARIIRHSFVASSWLGVPLTESREKCQINMDLALQLGSTAQTLIVDYRGYAGLPAGVTGGSKAIYYRHGSTETLGTDVSYPGPTSRDYLRRDCVPLDLVNEDTCPAVPLVTLNAEVRLVGASPTSGQMMVDSIDDRLAARIGTDNELQRTRAAVRLRDALATHRRGLPRSDVL